MTNLALYEERRRPLREGELRCAQCKLPKPTDHFIGRRGGVVTYCSECRTKYYGGAPHVVGEDNAAEGPRFTPGQRRSSRAGLALGDRSKTENVRRLGSRRLIDERLRLKVLQETDPVDLDARPKTRADCANVPRPCPWVGCRYNTFLDVTDIGSIKYNFGADLEPEAVEPEYSCALDIADLGGATLEDLSGPLNVTRERMRQIEEVALKRVKLHAKALREYCDEPNENAQKFSESSQFGELRARRRHHAARGGGGA